MPCKRPRQFHRTASMSQLGHGGSACPATAAVVAGHSHGYGGSCSSSNNSNCAKKVSASSAYDKSSNNYVPNPVIHNGTSNGAAAAAQSNSVRPGDSVEQQINIIRKAMVDNSTDHQYGILHLSPSPAPSPSPHFLDVCFLCMRSLGQGRDIFMYRGDRAFCSAECRQNQILADEKVDKCRMAAMIKQAAASSRSSANSTALSSAASTAANVQRVSNNTSQKTATAA